MAELLQFGENIDTMTFPECLAYIARHRRKMDRLEQIIRKRQRKPSVQAMKLVMK